MVWWCGCFLTDNNTKPTKVVLSCFGLLVGLWQYDIKKAEDDNINVDMNDTVKSDNVEEILSSK